jgi:hypothetical protein
VREQPSFSTLRTVSPQSQASLQKPSVSVVSGPIVAPVASPLLASVRSRTAQAAVTMAAMGSADEDLPGRSATAEWSRARGLVRRSSKESPGSVATLTAASTIRTMVPQGGRVEQGACLIDAAERGQA